MDVILCGALRQNSGALLYFPWPVGPLLVASFLLSTSVFSPSPAHLGRQETHLVVLVSRSLGEAGRDWAGGG